MRLRREGRELEVTFEPSATVCRRELTKRKESSVSRVGFGARRTAVEAQERVRSLLTKEEAVMPVNEGWASWRRDVVVFLALCLVVPFAFLQPALGYTETSSTGAQERPGLYYNRNSASNTLNGTMTAYVSIGSTRYRITMRGGSGNGTVTNSCTTDKGPAPKGFYGYGDGDPNSFLTFYNKTWGDSVVRGYVWEMGNKYCDAGTTLRKELFIHSQGTSGWINDNYKSAGCIKINQTDRSHLATRYNNAYLKTQGILYVWN